MADLDALADRVRDHFRAVHRDVFLGDAASNPKLKVEVVHAALVADTPMMVLIAPWTLNGLLFPPDGQAPTSLQIGAKDCPVFETEIEGLGTVHSVNLAADVSTMPSQDSARGIAAALLEPFRTAVAADRATRSVGDPDRRRLFGLGD